MEVISRSFRLERGQSLKLGRSNSSRLVSESISSKYAKITGYEKLSKSTSMSSPENAREDVGHNTGQRNGRSFRFWNKIFSPNKKVSGDCNEETKAKEDAEEKKKKKNEKKKRSSWLPDPERRWPVQGW